MTVKELKEYIVKEYIDDDTLVDSLISRLICENKIKHYQRILNNIGTMMEVYRRESDYSANKHS